MPGDLDLAQALVVAKQAADAACTVLMKHRTTLLTDGMEDLGVRTKSHEGDWVSVVDEEAQRAVIDVVTAAYPEHRILGEEEGADAIGSPDCPYRWVIDPLDGTNNYLRGNQAFGTIVALAHGTQPLLGVIRMPEMQRTFAGGKGLGVTYNGEPLTELRATKSLADAVISANIHLQKYQADNGEWAVPVPPECYIKNYGCAAQEMSDVLLQWSDGVAYRGIGFWDVSAACAMIAELGGRVRLEPLEAKNHRKGVRCVACTKKIYPELEAFVFGKK